MEVDHLFAVPVIGLFSLGIALLKATSGIPPLLTGCLLAGLTLAPNRSVRSAAENLSSPATVASSILTLQILFTLALLRKLNTYLNRLAQNNFSLRSEAHNYNWPHEVAVVTGAAGGIGTAICLDLAAKGLTVCALDIAPQLPPALHQNPRIHLFPCDVSSRAAVLSTAQAILAAHGPPSILINNAGVAYVHDTLRASEPALRHTLDVNLLAHYWTLHAFLPPMLDARKGHIVSVASLASFVATPGLGPYAASKAALLVLHECLAQELRVLHRVPEVKLSIVHPTFVATAMTRRLGSIVRRPPPLLAPRDVSRAVVEQVMSATGGQVVLSGALGPVPQMLRALPHWLAYAALRTMELGGPPVTAELAMRDEGADHEMDGIEKDGISKHGIEKDGIESKDGILKHGITSTQE